MKGLWDIIIGGLFIIYSLTMNLMSRRVLKLSLPFLMIGLLLIGFHYTKSIIKNKIIKIIMTVVVAIFAFAFLAIESVIVGAPKIDRQNSDYIVVLGSGINYGNSVDLTTRYRLDNVVDLIYKYCNNSYIVVSNGEELSKNKNDTEIMKKYLLDQGVSEDKILIEDKSRNIEQSLEYSKNIIEKHSGQNIENVNVKIVTSDYNAYRSKLMAKKIGYSNINTNSSSSSMYYTLATYLLEPIKLVKFLIL